MGVSQRGVTAVPVQPVAVEEQEPLLEGQESGNSVNTTKEDMESGGHSGDTEVRGTGRVRAVGWGWLCPPPMSCVPSIPAASGFCRDLHAPGDPHHRVLPGLRLQHRVLPAALGAQPGPRA